MKLKTLFHLAPRSRQFVAALKGMRNQDILPTREHVRLCADWLLYSQRISGSGGYAASYSLITGLRHAYIETTGYIVPTMFDLAVALGDTACRESALRAGEWLLSVQQAGGSFTDIDDYKPQVFDTGQVLFGLNRLYRETKDERYSAAAARAGDWLLKVQDADGSWTTAGYHRGQPCAYLSRVGAALLDLAETINQPRYRAGGVQNLHWTASQQQPNGFFKNSELIPGADPVLHTMVYVLEGFLMAYQITGQSEWLEILRRGAEPLKRRQLERDLVLRSQYDSELNVSNGEKCIPGMAQWAGVCLSLREITGDAGWFEAAQLSIYYLKSKQLRAKGILHGALPASVPIWGYYHPMMFPNWTVKFFADALLLYERHNGSVSQEQQAWVKKCFELQLDGGGWKKESTTIGPDDQLTCDKIQEALSSSGQPAGMALDLGCGEGRYLTELKRKLPEWKFCGVDPLPSGDNENIKCGSAYNIPFSDSSFDAVYTFIVLQHVHDLPLALGEIRRVLKPGGLLFIGDRDVWSGRGLKKPWHELKGRWMYPWDSPFRERWYSFRQWRRMLSQSGFTEIHHARTVGQGERGWRRWARINVLLLMTAQKK